MTPAAAPFDPRTTLARPDLAEQALEGILRADRYRPVRPMHAVKPVADLSADADEGSERLDQLVFGEAFDVLDRRGDRVWGRARRDGLVGWMDGSALQAGVPAATHRVASVSAALPLNALIAESAPGLDADAMAPIGSVETDPVEVAERLLGVPHEPGARSSVATDCSGLVQQALYACGLAGPRHADQQAQLGTGVMRDQARRGDLVVWLTTPGEYAWTGHSALMLDSDRVIHASGHHGAVVIEAFAEADARCRAGAYHAPVFRRLRP